jgi:hypothetical protein
MTHIHEWYLAFTGKQNNISYKYFQCKAPDCDYIDSFNTKGWKMEEGEAVQQSINNLGSHYGI